MTIDEQLTGHSFFADEKNFCDLFRKMRTATADVEIGGKQIKAGDRVVCWQRRRIATSMPGQLRKRAKAQPREHAA